MLMMKMIHGLKCSSPLDGLGTRSGFGWKMFFFSFLGGKGVKKKFQNVVESFEGRRTEALRWGDSSFTASRVYTFERHDIRI